MARNRKSRGKKPAGSASASYSTAGSSTANSASGAGRSSQNAAVPGAVPVTPAPVGTNRRQNKDKGLALRDCSRLTIRQPDLGVAVIHPYDIKLSREALENRGFHHAMTNLPVETLVSNYNKVVDHYCRPRPELISFVQGRGRKFNGKVVSQGRCLTRGFLTFRDSLMSGRFDGEQTNTWNADENKLAQVLNTVDIGGLVSQSLFSKGFRTVLSAATTSTQSWAAVTHSAKIWDFYAGEFSTDGPAKVFIAVTPEYTVGEFRDMQKCDPYGLNSSESLAGWFEKAMTAEEHIYFSIQALHTRLSRKPDYDPKLGHHSKDIVEYTRLLTVVQTIHLSNQFVTAPRLQVFRPSSSFALDQLHAMRKFGKILERSNTLTVLHFHKVPFLDRRLLAIILRACSKVEMLGVYGCPLVHFGDIICLLDLIHEINRDRRANDQPTVKALDFCPEFHRGMSSHQPHRAEAYGLSWGPLCLETVQRGVLCLVLKAFMKAKAMKLDLLFSKEGALLSYLLKLPQNELSMATFLDACHRLVGQHKRRSKGENAQKQLMYDLLKPVRVGLEKVGNDWSSYYIDRMGKSFYFCSSCGYEVVKEFFLAGASRQMPAHARTCAGCMLQAELDLDKGQLRPEKRALLDNLFPDWNKQAFNNEAPLAAASRALINLKTTESVRTQTPAAGLAYTFVRDRKRTFDSLQGLPSLSELLEGPESKQPWRIARHEANGLDMYSRVLWRLRTEGVPVTEKGKAWPRFDDRLPDHVHECQPPNYGTTFTRCMSMLAVKDEREREKKRASMTWDPQSEPGFW
ncbi:ribosomal protein L36 [Purpureocillium lilacinum]|uniref:Ribosomal protein L36 n=1 Tax=Purpureocillium lilacinum TaxID=33203 RepID=A0A179H1R2_PURLI|nr:ribosomal protein L36 [Purpureocillium lilacinum]OAQ83319.1 ribosomal protein L36 [Purpureocillium lilacinum]